MASSEFTKASRRKLWTCRIFSLLCNIGPALGLVIYAFIIGEPQTKFTLGATLIAAAILFVIGIMRKHMLRSSIWIIALGLYWALNEYFVVLLIFAATTLLDELILVPLINHYKTELIANKAIDKRS